MVSPRPLKLRTQVGRSATLPAAGDLPVARVLVDTGVFHLDSTYDYLVPENLSQSAITGCRVEVEFGHAKQEGLVVERIAESSNSGPLKMISKVLSPHVVATGETLELFSDVANRWAGAPYDVVRSAIPPRVALVDKESFPINDSSVEFHANATLPTELQKKNVRSYWHLPPSLSASQALVELAIERSRYGQVLLVVPDERMRIAVVEELDKQGYPADRVAQLDGHTSRSDRYRDYLRMTYATARIGVGLRGSVFTPLENGSTLIVFNDSSEHYFEPRTPGWNVRDVALLRTRKSLVDLVFVGYSPSLELGRLIDLGWLSLIESSCRMNIRAVEPVLGELLPSKVFDVVRKGLKGGPVLFLVPRKGYASAVLCRKCRNISICSCGGRLAQQNKSADPHCVICHTVYSHWRCSWCESDEIYIAGRGIERFAEEIGRAFPNYPVIGSSGEKILASVADLPSLVLATPGSVPLAENGYSAVVLLEGIKFFGHTDMRANENAREVFFSTASFVRPEGEIAVVIDSSHPIVAALTRWNPAPMIRKELVERDELNLPPFYRYITVGIDTKESIEFKNGLISAISHGRIPSSTKILGPHEGEDSRSRISLAAPVSEAEELVAFLHEFQRRRNISRKELLFIRVDPYSLS
ncbi:MAG: hypothetical protein F2951_02275 [Actinobacteria bacterium]|uniref:Unannotated protein n=1 Tax=freshwater metagenome TaxID=449393 RepID=A0A6J7V4C2_9ZZZZ|nr:hypothetical protein [Actinomycetota bacterium]